MRYVVTLTMTLVSPNDEDRVHRQVVSLFEFGTIKESFADALRLNNDPRLIDVTVRRWTKPLAVNPDRAA